MVPKSINRPLLNIEIPILISAKHRTPPRSDLTIT